MPEITELREGDPAEIAGHRLTGRLGSSVYAARSPALSPEPVVVRVLPAEMDPEPFLQAMEPLRGVAAVGTAQILAAGVEHERAYLVTELVDGPVLTELGGVLSGVGLYRLAAGTITALVALHEAGLAHGDIRPGNVLLGPDGPRLIDAGLEQALARASITTRKVAVPAFTAPERLRGAGAQAPADVFSWAATMVFAASGTSPFEGGSMAATVDRIENAEPELPDLGELHGLIVACLAKDPAARPVASEVLLRLVGQTSFLTGRVELGVRPDQDTRPARRGAGVVSLVAAFVVGALLSGAGVYAVTGNRPAVRTTVAAATSPSPAGTPTITAAQTAAPLEKVEKKAAADTKLATIGATFHEHPSDPVRVVAYLEAKGQFTSYARDRSGAFKALGATEEPRLSPGGDWVALNPFLKFQSSELDQVKFTKLSTGESFVVNTVKKPLTTMLPVWSRDGGRLLLSVYDAGKQRRLVGFVVVDLATRKAVHVETEYIADDSLSYTFTPSGEVAGAYWDGKRNGIEYYDMSGQVIKTMNWVGLPRDRDWFSPSGKMFVTICPNEKEICVWDARTGTRQATVPLGDDDGSLLGWFNDRHLLIQDPGKKKGTQVIKIVDFLGATKRVLADLTAGSGLIQFARVPGP
ncbi:serine/threonine protein kinase [Nonomuraea sp. NPDC002799]